MGDDDHRGVLAAVDLFKRLGQAGKAPQVDTGLRLVKDHQRAVARQNGGDLNALDLAAGKAHVHLALQIIVGAQAHLGQVLAAAVLAELFRTGREQQQIVNGNALEAGRLLEAVADTQLGPLGDRQLRHILPVKEHAAGGRLHQTHNNLGQRCLAAAVGTGEHHQLIVGDGDADILQNMLHTLRRVDTKTNMLQFQHG